KPRAQPTGPRTMGFANGITVTQSSVGTTRAINCDWMNGAPIGVSVTGSSSGTFAAQVQYTLDDVMLVASSLVSWIPDPNANLPANSSVIFTYTQPLAAIRLNITATSSSVVTFKVTQGSWL